jgi:hypothetical protein
MPANAFDVTRSRSWRHEAQPGGRAGSGAARTTADDSGRWLILATACVGYLMIMLDLTVMNLALPSAQHALGFTNAGRQWSCPGRKRQHDHDPPQAGPAGHQHGTAGRAA